MKRQQVAAGTASKIEKWEMTRRMDQDNDLAHVLVCFLLIAVRVALQVASFECGFVPLLHAMPCSFL